jgi:hypothetical protein
MRAVVLFRDFAHMRSRLPLAPSVATGRGPRGLRSPRHAPLRFRAVRRPRRVPGPGTGTGAEPEGRRARGPASPGPGAGWLGRPFAGERPGWEAHESRPPPAGPGATGVSAEAAAAVTVKVTRAGPASGRSAAPLTAASHRGIPFKCVHLKQQPSGTSKCLVPTSLAMTASGIMIHAPGLSHRKGCP